MGRLFLRAFASTLWLDPTAAAKAAGYSRPLEDGRRLMGKYSKIIERDKMSLFAAQKMTAEECQMFLSAHARGVLPMVATQVKSLELMLRVHGMLSDKVDVGLTSMDIEGAVLRIVSHVPVETRALSAATGAAGNHTLSTALLP